MTSASRRPSHAEAQAEPHTPTSAPWAILARALGAGTAPDAPTIIGRVTLHPHQRDAAGRLRAALARHGVALLADPPGLGKTYAALAATMDLGRLVVVAPAAVLPQWRRALEATGRSARVVSHEGLSRAPDAADADPDGPGVVIVDEAHHARTPTTRRWRHLAALCRRARVLLVTATPLHNRPRDLEALFALRLGPRAFPLDPALRDACLVRRAEADLRGDLPGPAPPVVSRWTWWRVPDAQDMPSAIARLPAVVPAADADALWRMGLLRAWSSSGAALARALSRRIAMTRALDAALAAGLPADRGLVRRWLLGDDAVQLPLALSDAVGDAAGPAGHTVDGVALAAHAAALRALLDARGWEATDAWRIARVRGFVRRHPRRRVLVFSQYEATARLHFRALLPDGGCALLTGAAARIATGRVARQELLDAFGPSPPRGVDALPWRVLVATDVVGEGVDLQGASAVVHADLPWTPARIAQRVGRVARLGATHRDVVVAAFAPPMPAERALGQERRLRSKAAVAQALLGADALAPARHRTRGLGAAGPQGRERLARLAVARAAQPVGPEGTWVGVGPVAGWVAVIGDGGRLLAARAGDPPREDVRLARRLLGPAARVDDGDARSPEVARVVGAARDAIARRLSHDMARMLAAPAPSAPVVRRLLARLGEAAHRLPRADRARAAARIAAVRAALAGPIPAGELAGLRALAGSDRPDTAWLAALSGAVATWDGAPVGTDVEVRALFVVLAAPDTIVRCPAPSSSTSTGPSSTPSR